MGAGMSEERFDRIDQELSGVQTRLDRLEVGQKDLTAQVGHMDARFDELRRHMGVLHESVLDRIAATREYTGPTRGEFAELKETIGRRLDPLETVVRHHSLDIEALKRTRT